jgi:hypothetical membrane protein
MNPLHMNRFAAVLCLFGMATVVVVCILSVVLTPGWQIGVSTFGDLGGSDSAMMRGIYNIGIVLGGMSLTVFGVHTANIRKVVPGYRAVSALIGLAGLCLALTGAFNIGTPYHVPFYYAMLSFASAAMILCGTICLLRHETKFGSACIIVPTVCIATLAVFGMPASQLAVLPPGMIWISAMAVRVIQSDYGVWLRSFDIDGYAPFKT